MTVALPIRSPEVLASRNGACARSSCEEPIVKGEHYIAKVEGQGWMHGQCVVAHLRDRELYEELNAEAGEIEIRRRSEIPAAIAKLQADGVPLEAICEDLELQLDLLRSAA